jgi:chromosome segregation protein
VFLEEAAGVSKYRERRRETELRLEDTRENLSRVGDIRAELEAQLTRLGEQAEVAAKYQDLQSQLALNQNFLTFTRLREAEQARNRHGNEAQKVQVALEAEMAKLRESERALEQLRGRHYEETDRLQEFQGALYAANAEVQSLEQEIAFLGENRRRMGSQLEAIGRERRGRAPPRRRRANRGRRRLSAPAIEARRRAARPQALPAAQGCSRGRRGEGAEAEMSTGEQARTRARVPRAQDPVALEAAEPPHRRTWLVFRAQSSRGRVERAALAAVASLEAAKDAEARLPRWRKSAAPCSACRRRARSPTSRRAEGPGVAAGRWTTTPSSEWTRPTPWAERLWQAIQPTINDVEAAPGAPERRQARRRLPALLRATPPGNFAVHRAW